MNTLKDRSNIELKPGIVSVNNNQQSRKRINFSHDKKYEQYPGMISCYQVDDKYKTLNDENVQNQRTIYQHRKGNENNKPKGIENTINRLLKDKRQLFQYLQAEKQFISNLTQNSEHNYKELHKPKGKLHSGMAITQKKYSRKSIGTRLNVEKSKTAQKTSKFEVQLITKNYHPKKIKNTSLTVQVVKKNGNQQQQSHGINSRQYETISFQQTSDFAQECQQKGTGYKKNYKCKTQNYQQRYDSVQNYSENFQFVIDSPKIKTKKPSINQNSYAAQNSLRMTKFGMTNFSPWAFPKDSHKNDFDFDFNANTPHQKKQKQYDQVLKLKKINEDQKKNNKEMIFKIKEKISEKKKIQIIKPSFTKNNKKPLTYYENKENISEKFIPMQVQHQKKVIHSQKNNDSFPLNNNNSIIKMQKNNLKNNVKNNVNSLNSISEPAVQIQKTKTPFCQEIFEDSDLKSKQCQKPLVNIVKTGNVLVFNNLSSPNSIFAPKSTIKSLFNTKNLLKNYSSLQKDKKIQNSLINFRETSTEKYPSDQQKTRIFHTQIDQQDQTFCQVSKYTKIKTQPSNNNLHDEEQDQNMINMKKTQQFLKQIRISKNTISLNNSSSNSQNKFKKSNQIMINDCQKNHFIETYTLQNDLKNHSSIQRANSSDILKQRNIQLKIKNQQQTININHMQGLLKSSQEMLKDQFDYSEFCRKKKAKTSLDKPNYEYEIRKAQQNDLNIKQAAMRNLTDSNIAGLQLLNESLLKNHKQSYIRRKHHSIIARKKSTNGQQSSQVSSKKSSFSLSAIQNNLKYYKRMAKIGNDNISQLCEITTGSIIQNPATKQLYKKYVTIVQNRSKK